MNDREQFDRIGSYVLDGKTMSPDLLMKNFANEGQFEKVMITSSFVLNLNNNKLVQYLDDIDEYK
jgi:hypothetical protein